MAVEALLATHSALRELPLFAKSKGAAVLHDVAGALRDVVKGGSPRLFSTARPGLPGGDGAARHYIRVNVVTAVRLLVEAHNVPEGTAQKTVATLFAAAGATGRKKAPLSATTVKDWCESTHALASKREDVQAYNGVKAQLDGFRSDPRWPGTYDDAVRYINGVASDPLLSSKYG